MVWCWLSGLCWRQIYVLEGLPKYFACGPSSFPVLCLVLNTVSWGALLGDARWKKLYFLHHSAVQRDYNQCPFEVEVFVESLFLVRHLSQNLEAPHVFSLPILNAEARWTAKTSFGSWWRVEEPLEHRTGFSAVPLKSVQFLQHIKAQALFSSFLSYPRPLDFGLGS